MKAAHSFKLGVYYPTSILRAIILLHEQQKAQIGALMTHRHRGKNIQLAKGKSTCWIAYQDKCKSNLSQKQVLACQVMSLKAIYFDYKG